MNHLCAFATCLYDQHLRLLEERTRSEKESSSHMSDTLPRKKNIPTLNTQFTCATLGRSYATKVPMHEQTAQAFNMSILSVLISKAAPPVVLFSLMMTFVSLPTQSHQPLVQSTSCGSILPRILSLSNKETESRRLQKGTTRKGGGFHPLITNVV